MLLALAGLSSAAMAQQKTEVVEYEIIQVQDKYQVITNPFGAIGSSLSAAVLKLLLVIMIVQEVLVSVSVLH